MRILGIAIVVLSAWVSTAHADAWDVRLVDRAAPSDTANVASTGGTFVGREGRYVVITSEARNLVPDQVDDYFKSDLFLYDRSSGSTALISHIPGSSTQPCDGITQLNGSSADGRFVLFTSNCYNLVAGLTDNNNTFDTFVYEVATGIVTLACPAAATPGATPSLGSSGIAISSDGSSVLLSSRSTDLVAGMGASPLYYNTYVRDRGTGTTLLASRKLGSPTIGPNYDSAAIALSADGHRVLFDTRATDVLPGIVDTNGFEDAFLFDATDGSTRLVTSAAGMPDHAGNGYGTSLGLSDDGTRVLLRSTATDFIAGAVDTNNYFDLFLFDLATQERFLVDHVAGSPLTASTAGGFDAAFSADGNRVAYNSSATGLVSGAVTQGNNAFLFDRATGLNRLLSHLPGQPLQSANGSSTPVRIAANGNRVLLNSTSVNLVTGVQYLSGGGNVFLYDLASDSVRLLSQRAATPPATGNGTAAAGAVNADGTAVTYLSNATDVLADSVDLNLGADVFVYDDLSHATALATRAQPSSLIYTAAGASTPRALSADGRYLLFASTAPDLIVGEDRNTDVDAFLYDNVTGGISLLSGTQGSATQADSVATNPVGMSDDARWILLNQNQIYLLDRQTGVRTLVSHAAGNPVTPANGVATAKMITRDGNWVLYASSASNLVTGVVDPAFRSDVFLYDRVNNRSILVSHDASSNLAAGNDQSDPLAVTPDGRFVLFNSYATNLVPGEFDAHPSLADVYVFDRQTGTISLVSHVQGSTAQAGNASSTGSGISDDGTWIVFGSESTDLLTGQQFTLQGWGQCYLFNRLTGSVVLLTHRVGLPLTTTDYGGTGIITRDGHTVFINSSSSNLAPGAFGTDSNYTEVYAYDVATGAITLVSHAFDNPNRAVSGGASLANAYAGTNGTSADGNKLLIASRSSDLVPNTPYTGVSNTYVFDRAQNRATLVSHVWYSPDQIAGTGFDAVGSWFISADGSTTAMTTHATTLVPHVAPRLLGSDQLYVARFAERVFLDGFESP